MANFIHEFSRSFRGKILFVIWLLMPLIVAGARLSDSPAAPPARLKEACSEAAFSWLLGTAAPFVITVFFRPRVLVISAPGLALRAAGGDGETLLLWKTFDAVEEDGRSLYFHRFWYSLSVPKDAFASPDEAEAFYRLALAFWHEARGIAPPPAPDTSGVWPPAPLNSGAGPEPQEPGGVGGR